MPRKDKISSVTMPGTIEDLIADLENERKERAARKPATAFGVITQIYPTLLSMKADGWSDMEICTTLKTRGITLSPGTLSTYMKKIGRGGIGLPIMWTMAQVKNPASGGRMS